MKLIKQNFQTFLPSFINENSSTLDPNLKAIQNNLKVDFNKVIRYLDKILDEALMSPNDTLSALHIHLEDEFTDSQKLLIAEFLLVKFFKYYQSIDNLSKESNLRLQELFMLLRSKQMSLDIRCPDGASAQRKNKIWKQWIQEKKDNKSLLDFYKGLDENSSIKSKLIFNTQRSFCRLLCQLFDFRPFAVVLGSKYQSYSLLNSTNTLNEVDNFNNKIIDDLESIVLFDCERKSLMANFSYEEINKWNSEYGTSFQKYLILTFGKGYNSINNVRNKVDTIKERFKIPIHSTYIILESEIDLLLKRKDKSSISIELIGFETSISWQTFLLETGIRELYELRSIKLMNIYSICLNDDIKSYILGELFSKSETSELISSSTKMAILELRDEDINVLKESLSNTLDLIINSEIKSKISERLCNPPSVILDEAIIRNSKLIIKFTNALGITRLRNLKSWSELKNNGSTSFLILSYRDQGKFPNYYYPNLLEFEYENGNCGDAILHNFLFGNHYRWSKYNILKEYLKYLSHPIRETHFEWDELKKLLQAQKPETQLKIDWNLENEYSSSENREAYKVKLQNQRAKTYHSSDLLIFSETNTAKPKIERVKWFFENEDIDATKYKVQKLDELLDEFNPAEKLIDTTNQEQELEIIRKQLGLGNETAGRIWKILLRKKSEFLGIEKLYEELKLIFEKNNIPLVSINHFRNSWINIESDSLMPRGNKVFKFLCDYLKLTNNYRLILYRLKNASISGKIEATKKYSNLLKDLFADGCFDNNASIHTLLQSRIQYYRNNHSLDELGIDSINPLNGLITLVELILPELKLMELETIEKIEQ